jgi:probable rRNA maturation factor
MGIEFEIAPEFSNRVLLKDLLRVAKATLENEKVSPSRRLTIVVVGDNVIRDLNRQFLRKDGPTDVLSFSYGEEGFLGDVVISYEMASRNARRYHWRVRDELSFLVAHGVLHLLGHQDTTLRAREEMWKRQEEIMELAGVNDGQSGRRRARNRSKSS